MREEAHSLDEGVKYIRGSMITIDISRLAFRHALQQEYVARG